MIQDIPTPAILISAPVVRRNVARLADYAKKNNLRLRPHTKTHKSAFLGRMQMEHGAIGLTVAKAGEAAVMATVADDILMAYPAVDPLRCAELARLARDKTIRVAIDSAYSADALSSAARAASSTIGVLVDFDLGYGRTGVQSPADALTLAQQVSRSQGLRFDGLFVYPGHLSKNPSEMTDALNVVEEKIVQTLDLFKRSGLAAPIVSGGSTPTAYNSHLVKHMTEFRPGTYIYNDMNCVHGKMAALEDCAARIVATVVSTTVPGQFVIDAGTKTLTSDRCGPAPDSGHGYILEYPQARIVKLTEEHGQVDISDCERTPRVGQQVTIIPNHICPCVNLQDRVWWQEENQPPQPMPVDARGKVF
jgi:D-serine deaminase-like pyridoxal phosphate-dependent protein